MTSESLTAPVVKRGRWLWAAPMPIWLDWPRLLQKTRNALRKFIARWILTNPFTSPIRYFGLIPRVNILIRSPSLRRMMSRMERGRPFIRRFKRGRKPTLILWPLTNVTPWLSGRLTVSLEVGEPALFRQFPTH